MSGDYVLLGILQLAYFQSNTAGIIGIISFIGYSAFTGFFLFKIFKAVKSNFYSSFKDAVKLFKYDETANQYKTTYDHIDFNKISIFSKYYFFFEMSKKWSISLVTVAAYKDPMIQAVLLTVV
jgi:hypothetical protein